MTETTKAVEFKKIHEGLHTVIKTGKLPTSPTHRWMGNNDIVSSQLWIINLVVVFLPVVVSLEIAYVATS